MKKQVDASSDTTPWDRHHLEFGKLLSNARAPM
jgi:hypothetical protein